MAAAGGGTRVRERPGRSRGALRAAPLRGVGIVVVMLCTFAVTTRRVGEGDRTEASAIGTLRAIQSAELAYATMSGGYYGSLDCLTSVNCLERGDHAALLAPGLAELRERNGYQFEFHRGPRPDRMDARDSTSATTRMTRYAIVAIPLSGGSARRRAFCGDDTGRIYVTRGDAVPRVEAARCADTSTPLGS
jgi:hypothetical protein